jgi:hypothetical protein
MPHDPRAQRVACLRRERRTRAAGRFYGTQATAYGDVHDVRGGSRQRAAYCGAEPRWAAAGAPPLMLPGSATAEVAEIAVLDFVVAKCPPISCVTERRP